AHYSCLSFSPSGEDNVCSLHFVSDRLRFFPALLLALSHKPLPSSLFLS
ncbi:hypothetical protein CSUI_008124, partial [Cystoisospora suis]